MDTTMDTESRSSPWSIYKSLLYRNFGRVAKWLGNGLQIRLRGFDSRRDLQFRSGCLAGTVGRVRPVPRSSTVGPSSEGYFLAKRGTANLRMKPWALLLAGGLAVACVPETASYLTLPVVPLHDQPLEQAVVEVELAELAWRMAGFRAEDLA